MELWNDVLAEEERHARKHVKTPLRKSNVDKPWGDGCYRKAIQALSSGGLAQITPEVMEQMPVPPPPPIQPDPSPSPPNISDQVILRALKSFPSGSAP